MTSLFAPQKPLLTGLLLLGITLILGCQARPGSEAQSAGAPVRFSAGEKAMIARLSPLEAPPPDETNAVVDDARAAHLGQFLFFDTRLSANNEISCASCHQPTHGFSAPTRVGHGLGKTPRHVPSLLNTAYHPWFDWDGRADSIWAQAFGPLESPQEMGFSRAQLAHLMADDAELRGAYETIFGALPDLSDAARFPRIARPIPDAPDAPANRAWEKMHPEDQETINRIATNTTKAIAAYVTQLIQGDAPFDRFAAQLGASGGTPREDAPLSPQAQRGLRLFLGKAGCARCHVGPTFSDDSFHNLGLGTRGWLEPANPGRYRGVAQVKGNIFNAAGIYSDARQGKKSRWIHYLHPSAEDRGQFKTPTLRNIALSPPYMHGGHFSTLKEVVRFYSRLDEQVQIGHREDMLLPLGLSETEEDEVVAFLESLTGAPLPPELLHPPASPLAAPLADSSAHAPGSDDKDDK